jgi:dihydroxyacetone kinase-like protein
MSTDSNLEYVVKTIAETAVANEKEFGDLDAVVGDGDFGYSLARGFEIVVADWDSFDRSTSADLLKKIALVISSRVGGTSGPLWGTAFLRASAAVKDKEDLEPSDAVAMLQAAAEGIKKRGNSDVGDKTLLDALIPMTDAIAEALAADGSQSGKAVADLAAARARESAEATTSMQAMRGRASYTGERSIGSPDAGAMAVALMAERVAEDWPAPA